jgi:hypothetical protein
MEIENNPDVDWIDEVLVPAIEPIARRKSVKIRETPIENNRGLWAACE